MANPRCKMCNKIKTKANTAMEAKDGKEYFRYLCKKCDAERMRHRIWSTKTDSDLRESMVKHMRNARLIAKELKRRTEAEDYMGLEEHWL